MSSSKDTLLKVWDLYTQHCVSTNVAHRTQVWSLAVFVDTSTNDTVIITGGGEGEAKAWRLDFRVLESRVSMDNESTEPARAVTPLTSGLLPLQSLTHTHRIAQVAYHPEERLLAVQTTDRAIEILRLRSAEEIRKKAARRRKREQEKLKEKGEAAASESISTREPEWKDRLASWIVIRTPGKIRSFGFGLGNTNLKGEVNIMAALANNAVEVYQLPQQPLKTKNKDADAIVDATLQYSLDIPGHRTDIRTMALSSDDELLATGSNGQLKIWNVKTTKCLRTMECGYAISLIFLPGNRHIVVGTKSGVLYLYDIASSTLLETIQGHTMSIWSLCLRADGKGFVSGGEDKDVKFWEFGIKDVILNEDEIDAPPVSDAGTLAKKADIDFMTQRCRQFGRL